MIIKVISTQSYNEDSTRPYYVKDLNNIPVSERKQYYNYLVRNHKAGLLKMEVITC